MHLFVTWQILESHIVLRRHIVDNEESYCTDIEESYCRGHIDIGDVEESY